MKWLVILLLIPSAFAQTYKVNGRHLTFTEKDGLISRHCEEFKLPSKSFEEICTSTFLGIAENGDGRAFCRFEKGCLIEMNSLRTKLK